MVSLADDEETLRDHSLPLATLIRPHAAVDVCVLGDETPKTVMKGWANTSHIDKHVLYDFVM